MRFEEEFPSLVGLRINTYNEDEYGVGYTDNDNGELIFVENIQKHCLDKQRVNDIINSTITNIEERLELKEELRLE